MNAKQPFVANQAHVDKAAIAPLPNSRKVYIEGSRPDIQVPMREISLADTPTAMGGERNAPVESRTRIRTPLRWRSRAKLSSPDSMTVFERGNPLLVCEHYLENLVST